MSESPELVGNSLDESRHLLCLTHIGLECNGAAAGLPDLAGLAVRVLRTLIVVDRHRNTLAGERLDDGRPDPTGRARHEGYSPPGLSASRSTVTPGSFSDLRCSADLHLGCPAYCDEATSATNLRRESQGRRCLILAGHFDRGLDNLADHDRPTERKVLTEVQGKRSRDTHSDKL